MSTLVDSQTNFVYIQYEVHLIPQNRSILLQLQILISRIILSIPTLEISEIVISYHLSISASHLTNLLVHMILSLNLQFHPSSIFLRPTQDTHRLTISILRSAMHRLLSLRNHLLLLLTQAFSQQQHM